MSLGRLLGLAGIVQSANAIAGIAKSGMVSQDTLVNSLHCIFVQNPDSISDIYNGTEDIKLGIEILGNLLSKFDLKQHGEIVRYVLAIIALERTLSQRTDITDAISTTLPDIESSYPDQLDTCIPSLANLYESTLATLEPRIQISGNKQHLQNEINVQRIRALLLSGLRSAVLWHQLGGRRWQLLFSRSSMYKSLNNLK
ncbi:MAG: high frequency lysogenization protein [Candidatus Azotimanducaceae bacterium]|jgi:high frequency lysogenization protein